MILKSIPSEKMLLVIVKNHPVLRPLELPSLHFSPCVPKQSVAGFLLLPTIQAHSQPASGSQPSASPSRHLYSTCTLPPICSANEAKQRAQGLLSTYPWTSRLFRSALSDVNEPGHTVRRPYWTRLPQHKNSGSLGQPGPQGYWVGGRMSTAKGAGCSEDASAGSYLGFSLCSSIVSKLP